MYSSPETNADESWTKQNFSGKWLEPELSTPCVMALSSQNTPFAPSGHNKLRIQIKIGNAGIKDI